MLGYVYTTAGALNTNQDLGVKVATPVGTLVGQLLFGWLADVVGRKRMCTLYSAVVFIFFVLNRIFTIRRCRVNDHHHCHIRSGSCWNGSRSWRHRCPHRLAFHRQFYIIFILLSIIFIVFL